MKLPARTHELKQFLGSLPVEKAAKLAIAVERGRLAGEKSLPADLILEGLRPALKQASARRTPTVQRLFCEPFADFLVDSREFKQPGRIARSSIPILWHWLERDGLRATLSDYETQITRALLARDTRLERDLVQQFQREAAQVIHSAMDRVGQLAGERRILSSKFGGDDALYDVEEIGLLLAAAAELSALRGLLPKRIDTLNAQHTDLIGDIYDELAQSRPELSPYVSLLVLGRLRRPWEVLRLTGLNSRRTNGALLSQTDTGLIGDILLADMENMALDIASARLELFDPDSLLNKLERFTQMSSGLVREIGPKRDGKWGQRLIKIRQLGSDAMDALMMRAPREIIAALPVQRIGAFGGRAPQRPDFSREPDRVRFERAILWGRLLTGATPYASSGDFHAAHKQAFEETSQYLRSYLQSLALELKALDYEKRPRALAFQSHAQALADAIIGRE